MFDMVWRYSAHASRSDWYLAIRECQAFDIRQCATRTWLSRRQCTWLSGFAAGCSLCRESIGSHSPGQCTDCRTTDRALARRTIALSAGDLYVRKRSGAKRRGHEVEMSQGCSVLNQTLLASSNETRDVPFAPKAKRSGDRTKRRQSLMPAEPGDELAQRPAARGSDHRSRCFGNTADGRDHLLHRWTSDGALRHGVIGRTWLRFDLPAHPLGPLGRAEIDAVHHLVPEPFLTIHLRQHELAVLLARARTVCAEGGEGRVQCEPVRRDGQAGSRPIARPHVLFR